MYAETSISIPKKHFCAQDRGFRSTPNGYIYCHKFQSHLKMEDEKPGPNVALFGAVDFVVPLLDFPCDS